MIHRLPQHELNLIKNSAPVQEACMTMYKRKYDALHQVHGDKLPAVLQPFIDLMQGKIYTIPTESWGTAAHAVWLDHHRDSTVLIHCHAAIWQVTQNPSPENESSPPLQGEVAVSQRGILPQSSLQGDVRRTEGAGGVREAGGGSEVAESRRGHPPYNGKTNFEQ